MLYCFSMDFLWLVYATPSLYSVDYERNRTSPFCCGARTQLLIIKESRNHYLFVRKSTGNPKKVHRKSIEIPPHMHCLKNTNDLNSELFGMGSYCLLLASHTGATASGKPVCTESRAARHCCTGWWSGQEPLGTLCCYSTREIAAGPRAEPLLLLHKGIATRPRAEPMGNRIDNLINAKYVFSNVLGWGWISWDFP